MRSCWWPRAAPIDHCSCCQQLLPLAHSGCCLSHANENDFCERKESPWHVTGTRLKSEKGVSTLVYYEAVCSGIADGQISADPRRRINEAYAGRRQQHDVDNVAWVRELVHVMYTCFCGGRVCLHRKSNPVGFYYLSPNPKTLLGYRWGTQCVLVWSGVVVVRDADLLSCHCWSCCQFCWRR